MLSCTALAFTSYNTYELRSVVLGFCCNPNSVGSRSTIVSHVRTVCYVLALYSNSL